MVGNGKLIFKNMLKLFNKVFGLIGITIGNPTTIVISSATPHEVSMMPDGGFSMRCSIEESKQESYWVLYLWKWSIKLTKTKVTTWNNHSFMADISTKTSPTIIQSSKIDSWSMGGKIQIDDHELRDIFKTFNDL